jgi:hypothetical protein
MLSDEQKRVALKKNMEAMSKEAKKLRADGVEGITLTYYADEESFQKMRLDVETEDFAFRQMMTIETAKLMIKHGLDIEVQVLDADNYFSWLGECKNTYEAQRDTQVVNIYLVLML